MLFKDLYTYTYVHRRLNDARTCARVHISYTSILRMYVCIVYNSDNYNASFMISNNNRNRKPYRLLDETEKISGEVIIIN